MLHRRHFLQISSLGLTALGFSSFKGKGATQKPVVLSTWDAGIAANKAARRP